MYSSAEARDGNGTRGAIYLDSLFGRNNLFLLRFLLQWWWEVVTISGSLSTSSGTVWTLLWSAVLGGEGPLEDHCGLVWSAVLGGEGPLEDHCGLVWSAVLGGEGPLEDHCGLVVSVIL